MDEENWLRTTCYGYKWFRTLHSHLSFIDVNNGLNQNYNQIYFLKIRCIIGKQDICIFWELLICFTLLIWVKLVDKVQRGSKKSVNIMRILYVIALLDPFISYWVVANPRHVFGLIEPPALTHCWNFWRDLLS